MELTLPVAYLVGFFTGMVALYCALYILYPHYRDDLTGRGRKPATGTFTVPTGVARVEVSAQGGGGSGGSEQSEKITQLGRELQKVRDELLARDRMDLSDVAHKRDLSNIFSAISELRTYFNQVADHARLERKDLRDAVNDVLAYEDRLAERLMFASICAVAGRKMGEEKALSLRTRWFRRARDMKRFYDQMVMLPEPPPTENTGVPMSMRLRSDDLQNVADKIGRKV